MAEALTATEYELLRVLSLDAGRVVTFDNAAAPGLGQAREGRCELGARLRQGPSPQARRQRGRPRLHLQPARRRLQGGRVALKERQLRVTDPAAAFVTGAWTHTGGVSG